MSMKGKKHSEETKKLIGEKAKGNKSFSGRKHTEEWKMKMRGPRPKARGRVAWNKGKGMFQNLRDKERYYNLKKYGIDQKGYTALLEKQNGVCAICLKTESKKHQNGKIANLSVDHDHKTGKVRGLLCNKCNFAIGHLDDNPYLCEKAMVYLLGNN